MTDNWLTLLKLHKTMGWHCITKMTHTQKKKTSHDFNHPMTTSERKNLTEKPFNKLTVLWVLSGVAGVVAADNAAAAAVIPAATALGPYEMAELPKASKRDLSPFPVVFCTTFCLHDVENTKGVAQ